MSGRKATCARIIALYATIACIKEPPGGIKMRRLFWLLGGLLLLGVWPLLAQSPEGAHWRLGHFAIDVPEVDVYLDDTLMLQQIKLSTVSGWRDLPSGAHTITIT